MDPKILRMKIWSVNNTPAFCGYEEDESVYSVIDKTICQKSGLLRLLEERVIMPEDLNMVIMHNLLSPEDFEALLQKGLVPEDQEILYRKIQALRDEVESLRAALQQPVVTSPAVQAAPEPQGGIAAVLDLIRACAAGEAAVSVYDQIVQNTSGLSENDKKLLELVASHFSGISAS